MLRNLVLVKLDDIKTKSAIELPEAVKQEKKISATSGTAVVVGPECEIETGVRVKYPSYIGNEVRDEALTDGVYIVVSESDIIMTIEK